MITPKKLHRLQAVIWFVAGVVVPIFLLRPSGGSKERIPGAAILGGIFLAVSVHHWCKFRKTSDNAIFYEISKQPPVEQIRGCKRSIWVLAILGPVLSCWTYYDLFSVETGAEQSVSVWVPVAMLYNFFGFWPAVLCWPLFCSLVIGASFIRIQKAKSMLQQNGNN